MKSVTVFQRSKDSQGRCIMAFAKLPDGQVPCENPNIRIFIGSEPMRTQGEARPEAQGEA